MVLRSGAGGGGGNNLTLSQVHFPRVCVVLHASHTAVHVCIHRETKARQLPHFQREDCYDSDHTGYVTKGRTDFCTEVLQ